MSAYSKVEPITDTGATVAVMKQLAEVLHDHGACDRLTCPFCVPGVHGGLSSPEASAPALASPGDAGPIRTVYSTDAKSQLMTHTIKVLRQWDEPELAMSLTNAWFLHDPKSASAVAAGWTDE